MVETEPLFVFEPTSSILEEHSNSWNQKLKIIKMVSFLLIPEHHRFILIH